MAVTSGAAAQEVSGPDTTVPGTNRTGLSPERTPADLSQLRWRQVFPGHELQLRELRRWLIALLPECPARDDVISVATKLGTNAVRHTTSGEDGWFAVELTWCGAVVRVAVADGGAMGGPRVIDDPMGEGGRGLLMVRELATRIGVSGDHRGRLVWAEIRWDVDAGPPPSSRDPYEAAIQDGEAELAQRFAGVATWFGRSTLQWWALPPSTAASRLVDASSPRALAQTLDFMLAAPQRSARFGAHDTTVGDVSGGEPSW